MLLCYSEGYFVEPTIIETTDPQDKLMREEIFGPVITMYKYKDDEWRNVLQMIDSSTEYSLTGAVFAEDQ